MKKKIGVIGCGNVGVSYIYSLINKQINNLEIVIIDKNENKTKGEILDFKHCLPFLNLDLNIYLGTYQDLTDAYLIIVCAGAKQEVNESRMDLLTKNAKIIKDIALNIKNSGFKGLIINATNPLDVMTMLIYENSNLPAEKVIGSGTFLDTQRLKLVLHEKYQVSFADLDALVIGEHGDSLVIPWSKIKIKNENISNYAKKEELLKIYQEVNEAGYELLNTKGYSSLAIGVCLSTITQGILENQEINIPVSNYDAQNNIYYSYPVILNNKGILKRAKLHLTKEEENKLKSSVQIIKDAYNQIKTQK